MKQLAADLAELHRTGAVYGHPLLSRALLLLLEGDAVVTRRLTWRALVDARAMDELGRVAEEGPYLGLQAVFLKSPARLSEMRSEAEAEEEYAMMVVLLDYLEGARRSAGSALFFVGVAREGLRRYLSGTAHSSRFQTRLVEEKMDEALRGWVMMTTVGGV